MQLNISLKCGTLRRSFFVTCEGHRTFEWLAKVVFHRYTIFVPQLDKLKPFDHDPTTEPQSPDKGLMMDSNSFSPPISGVIAEYLSDGDMVVCCLDKSKSSSNAIRVKFFIKSTGQAVGRTYAVISAATQEKLRAQFQQNQFHKFQLENQKKLTDHVNKKLVLDTATPGHPLSPTAKENESTKILTPRPPSFDDYRRHEVFARYNRRHEEKVNLKANNKPLYDYDPGDIDEIGEFLEQLRAPEGVAEREGYEETTIDEVEAFSRRRRHSQALSSRQISIHLRRMSSKRISTQGLKSLQNRTKTAVRDTVLQMFKLREDKNKDESENSFANELNNRNNEFVCSSKAKFMKPNGPQSNDVLWRQRALGIKSSGKMKPAGITALAVVAKNREARAASASTNLALLNEGHESKSTGSAITGKADRLISTRHKRVAFS